MTIQDLGSLGELVAAIATVATLAYLAFQIRQNTRAIKGSSHHAITDSFNQMNLSLGRDPALGRIFRAGSANLKGLTEDERTQFGFLCISYMRVYETLFYQSRVGTVDQELFRSELRSLARFFDFPGVTEWWTSNTWLFSPEFRSFVEQHISRGGQAAPPAA